MTISSMTVVGELDLDGTNTAVTLTVQNGTLTNNGIVQIANSANAVTIQAPTGKSLQYLGTDIDYNATRKVFLSRVEYLPAVTLASGETIELAGPTTFYAFTAQTGSSFIQGTHNNLTFRGNTTFAAGTFTKDAGTGTIRFKSNISANTAGQDLGNVQIGGN